MIMSWLSDCPCAKLTTIPDYADACEHVEADPTKAVHLFKEDDSFGPVGRYYTCEACREKTQKENDDADVTCDDCKGEFKKGETSEWRWYDFYAAQGDEPYVLCESCRKADKHKERVRKDRATREEEDEYYRKQDERYSF